MKEYSMHPPRHLLESVQLLAELSDIYSVRAHGRYGLSQVTQRMHAIQCASLAQAQGFAPTLVVAALLHDIGHMVHDLGEHPAAEGIDDQHEAIGSRWLARYFPPSVSEPVRLHVAAKRYLCATDERYIEKLSSDSIESLALQGGPMSESEVAAFQTEQFWRHAIALRRLDDAAKDPDAPLLTFETFLPLIEAALGADDESSIALMDESRR